MSTVSRLESVRNTGPDYVCPTCGKPLSVCTCSGGRHHIHTQHGADRAILGLSRTGCRNVMQLRGYDAMAAEIAAWQTVAGEGIDDEGWGAELQARLDAAERRRAYALELAGTIETAVSYGQIYDVAVYSSVEVYS